MEGGLLIHAAWALSFVFVWIYRRWFEKSAPRCAEFEAFCARQPSLAALLVRRGDERAVAERLTAALSRGETIATHGAWPWVHYVLAVEWVAGNGVVRGNVRGCRVLRTREARPPSLTHLLTAMLAAGGGAEEAWLHPRAYVDVSGRSLGEHGWRIVAGAPAKRPCAPWNETPDWVSAASSRASRAPSSAAFAPSPARPQFADS